MPKILHEYLQEKTWNGIWKMSRSETIGGFRGGGGKGHPLANGYLPYYMYFFMHLIVFLFFCFFFFV